MPHENSKLREVDVTDGGCDWEAISDWLERISIVRRLKVNLPSDKLTPLTEAHKQIRRAFAN